MSELKPVAERLHAHVQALTGAAVAIEGLKPLAGGACQDNLRVDLTLDGAPHRWVLRSDAPTSLPGSLDRAAEYAVIAAARSAGVSTPHARGLAVGLVRPGAHAYLLDWIDGDAIGARVVRHPSLAAARDGLVAAVAAEAAAIHRVTPQTHPDLPIERPPFNGVADPGRAAIALIEGTLNRLPTPRPAAELALRWLRAHCPAPAAPALVHGDFRTGNFMVSPSGLTGVLDWEFSHWGDPAEDLGWLCVRDWRFGALAHPVGGFGTSRDALRAAYAAAGGAPIDAARLHWWEVAGNLKWGAFAGLQGARYADGQVDLELLAIPRRAAEMEYEALRLIDRGPEP